MTPYSVMDVCVYSQILPLLAPEKGLTHHDNYIPYTHRKPRMHKTIFIAIQNIVQKSVYRSAV